MKKLLLLAILVGIAAVLFIAAGRPDEFRIERSVDIHAPPERIFPLVDNLHGFATWSPYEEKDPMMKRAYAGPPNGKGASYEWDGNRNVGRGQLEIVDSVAPSRVTMKLDMIAPLEGHNTVDFTFEPRGDATHVTWAMHGPMPFVSKVFSVFVDMDDMVGRDFETGLVRLKAEAEK